MFLMSRLILIHEFQYHPPLALPMETLCLMFAVDLFGETDFLILESGDAALIAPS
jgi:hypothetical protein